MVSRIIICLDGCGPEYLAPASTPNLDALASAGFYKVGRSTVPTVTNVNNTTIVTASYPESHGITSNYFLDPATGREHYMESSEYLLAETIFRRSGAKGWKSALLTAKDKLKTLIRDGVSMAESAEKPSAWLVDRLGPPPGIYDVELNHWLFRAAVETLRAHAPDLLYLTTTDYAMHAFAPEEERSQWNISRLDKLLGEILNAAGEFEIVVTADHGMNAKTCALDLNRILHARGIGGNAIPIIRDRYVAHHQNMGGAAYVYVDDPARVDEAMAILSELPGVESVLRSGEAAALYRLHPGRIGHIFVLADRDAVFGCLRAEREEVRIRSHGSLHELEIPIIGCGPGPVSGQPECNRDVAAWIL